MLGGALAGVATFTPLKHLVIAVQDPWLGHGTNWAALGIVAGILAAAGCPGGPGAAAPNVTGDRAR